MNLIDSFLDEVGVRLDFAEEVRKRDDIVRVLVRKQASLAVQFLVMILAHGVQANERNFLYWVATAWRSCLGPQCHLHVCGYHLLRLFFHI